MACPQHHQYIWFCLVTFICLHCQDCTAHPQGGNGEGITFYVSAAGDDTWSGRGAIPNADRTDGPLATVNRAAVLSKEHKDVVVTVKIEPWTYYLDSTLSLDSSHSRSPSAPLTFSGCPKTAPADGTVAEAFPVLSGGYKLTNTTRLDMGNYIVHVPNNLIGKPITQLFVNGQREPVARKPNHGYLYWKSPIKPCSKSRDEDDYRYLQGIKSAIRSDPCPDIDRYGFVFNEGDIGEDWKCVGDAWIMVFAAWSATWHHVASIDFDNNTVMFVEPSNYAVGDFVQPSGRRYYIENVLEELDAPGEWFYNKDEGFITYKPRVDETERLEFVVPVLQHVISLTAAENVHFECLSIQHSLEGTDNRQAYHSTTAAVQVSASSHISFSKCDVQHAGATCMFLGQESSNINIEQSRVADCGGDGISMDQNSAHILVQNNIVNTTGFIYMMQPTGIRVQGQRNITIEHNEVLNVPYGAVMVGWQAGYPWTPEASPDHYVFYIRYNHVHHYGLGILNDFGGVYVSAQVACWQHKSADAENAEPPSCNMAARVEQNIMHDAVCYNYGADGFYTDENAEGVDLVSNLIYDVQSAGVYFHCGVNLTSTNNFVYNADSGGHRGALSGCNMGGFSKHLVLDANYQRNIVYVVGKASHFSTPNTQVDNSTFNQNLYYDPSKPLVFPNGADFQQWQASGRDKQSKVADPKFVSVEKRDFHLSADSPARAMGIQPIDIEMVGPQGNPFLRVPASSWTPLLPLQKSKDLPERQHQKN